MRDSPPIAGGGGGKKIGGFPNLLPSFRDLFFTTFPPLGKRLHFVLVKEGKKTILCIRERKPSLIYFHSLV